ncbi:MAG: hypothetical protein ACTHMH_03555 [Curtobacterium sp.]
MARPERAAGRPRQLVLPLAALAVTAATLFTATPASAAPAASPTTAPTTATATATTMNTTATTRTTTTNTPATTPTTTATVPGTTTTLAPTMPAGATPSDAPADTTDPTDPPTTPALRSFTTTAPTVTGTLKVGGSLTVTAPSWKPAPTTVGYRWYRDGVAIGGAYKTRYTPTVSDRGHKLTVSITGSRSGYETTTRNKYVGIVARGDAPRATKNPAVAGITRSGSVLTTSQGSWNTSGLTYRYEWSRNGTVVPSMTGRTYRLGYYDVGAKISSRVIVSKNGYTDGSARSAATAAISKAAVAFSGDGTYRVGTQVKAGTYYSTTKTSQLCYWARLSSAQGRFEDIRANDLGSGQRLMTISSSDKYVELDDCGAWYPVGSAGPKLANISSDGVYVVGPQVSAGTTWRTSAPAGCYWATYSAADGDIDSIIANDYRDSRATVTVTIPKNAVGFESSGCGTWKKVG